MGRDQEYDLVALVRALFVLKDLSDHRMFESPGIRVSVCESTSRSNPPSTIVWLSATQSVSEDDYPKRPVIVVLFFTLRPESQ